MSTLDTRHLRPKSWRQKSPSTKALARYITENTGVPVRFIRLVLHSLTCFLQQELAKGGKVNVWSLGTFCTKLRKGRKMPARTISGGRGGSHFFPPTEQPDSYHVKFKASPILKEHVHSRKP